MKLTMCGSGVSAGACLLLALAVVAGAAAPAQAGGLQQQPAGQVDEFVPLDELPPDEQLPAAPLVMIAYAAAWIVVLIYLATIWRRLSRVEEEIALATRRAQRDTAGARTSHNAGEG